MRTEQIGLLVCVKDIEVKRDVELGRKVKVFMSHNPQIWKIFVELG